MLGFGIYVSIYVWDAPARVLRSANLEVKKNQRKGVPFYIASEGRLSWGPIGKAQGPYGTVHIPIRAL